MIVAFYKNRWWKVTKPTETITDVKIVQCCDILADTVTKNIIKDRTGMFTVDSLTPMLMKQWVNNKVLEDLPDLTAFTVARFERTSNFGMLS